MKKLLPIFSYVLHPVFIPLFGAIYFFFIAETGLKYTLLQAGFILMQVFFVAVLVPISFYFVLKQLGKMDSVMVENLNQRKLPLGFQILLMLVLIQNGTTIDRIPELFFFFLGGIISALITLILLFCNIKASIHLIGITSLCFFVVGLSLHEQTNNLISISLLLFLIGITASSRLVMKAHTFFELILGFLIGTLSQILLWYFWV